MEKCIIIDNFGEVQKNSKERILVRLCEFNGYRYLDIRIFSQFENGKYYASSKGVTLNSRNFFSFFNILLKNQEIISVALNAKTPAEFEKELAKTKKSIRQTDTRKMKRERMEADSKQLEFGFELKGGKNVFWTKKKHCKA